MNEKATSKRQQVVHDFLTNQNNILKELSMAENDGVKIQSVPDYYGSNVFNLKTDGSLTEIF